MSTDTHIAFMLLGAVILLLIVVTVLSLELTQMRKIVNCSVLTYSEAQKELTKHPGLDRNHNGVACDNNPH